MFLMMGVAPEQEQLDFSQLVSCPCCGQYGRIEVFVISTVLRLFFLPVFKWKKQYFARIVCCGAQCSLAADLGQEIAAGRVQSLDTSALHFCGGAAPVRLCSHCGFSTSEDFSFCPKCGRPF